MVFFKFKMLLILILSMILFNISNGYNLNDKALIILKDPYPNFEGRATYFGYSVSFYINELNNTQVVVGAPRANISSLPKVIEPGTVFKCSLNNNQCVEWLIDTLGNELTSKNVYQNRDNSWTGANIFIEDNRNPLIIICSPRWKMRHSNMDLMNGMCYVHQSNTKIDSFERFKPLNNILKQTFRGKDGLNYPYYAMGQFGFSFHFYSDNNYPRNFGIEFGSPGVWVWNGVPVHVYGDEKSINYITPDPESYGHQYFGYSVTSGHYFRYPERLFAASYFETKTVKGKVMIYSYEQLTDKIINLKEIKSSYTGEYFGYSLVSCDVDGDLKDELIVGAPLWSNYGDEGRVYVYTSKDENHLEIMSTMEGQGIDSRFGTTITCLKDLDHDGYGDLAVGAPYEDNHGAIYIFNGNKNGISSLWSQKIVAKDFQTPVRGFGISISEPRDIDQNGYYDIAVGAYLSGHTAVFKSQPVIVINTNVTYLKFNDNNSFSIEICDSYRGLYVSNSLEFIQVFKIDSDYERAFIKDAYFDSASLTYNVLQVLNVNETNCQSRNIFLKKNINLLNPLKISVSLMLNESIEGEHFCSFCSVINKNQSQIEDRLEVSLLPLIDDGLLISNLTLLVKSNLKNGHKYVMGSVEPIKLDIEVNNYGESAYQTQVSVIIPEFISLFRQPDNCKEYLVMNKIECDFGNPLEKKKITSLELNMSKIKIDQENVVIKFSVTTQNKNSNEKESTYDLLINFEEDIDITVVGKAEKSVYLFSEENGKINEQNFTYQHIYEVRKFGVTNIKRANLQIFIPTHFNSSNESELSRVENIQLISSSSSLQTTSSCYKTKIINSSDYNRIIPTLNSSTDLASNQNSFHIDCNNSIILCTIIYCDLEVLNSETSTIGKVTININFLLKEFYDNITKKNDIYFTSFGLVNIALPQNITQKPDNKPDFIFIQTKLINITLSASKSVSGWIIFGSILVGLILLILLVFILIKIGFFNRKKKEDLEKLKANEGITSEANLSSIDN